MVDAADWRKVKVDGSRRYGRVLLPDLSITPILGKKDLSSTQVDEHSDTHATFATADQAESDGAALEFVFSLPKGAFATVVLREFMKVDLADATEIDSDVE